MLSAYLLIPYRVFVAILTELSGSANNPLMFYQPEVNL
jgi:hypothetical protein